MKLDKVTDVIAVRELRANLRAGESGLVSVIIGRPKQFPDSDAWYCPYQIIGLGSGRVKYGAGVDAVQALQLVMPMIGVDLFALKQQYECTLVWDEDDLGFPEAA